LKRILETERTYLRELAWEDYDDLCEILQDEKTMYAYEHAFSDEEVRNWLNNQFRRYKNLGFGLWAVVDRNYRADRTYHAECREQTGA
jgi:RimJ/RimL family protein N-acetyltransferase